MRRVGVSQNEHPHFDSNPRKPTHIYLMINFLRYRVLSPAPLARLGDLRSFFLNERGPRPGLEPGPEDPQSSRTTTTPSRPLLK